MRVAVSQVQLIVRTDPDTMGVPEKPVSPLGQQGALGIHHNNPRIGLSVEKVDAVPRVGSDAGDKPEGAQPAVSPTPVFVGFIGILAGTNDRFGFHEILLMHCPRSWPIIAIELWETAAVITT